MLKRQSRFYISILALGDLVGALFSWIMAYYFRFYVDIIPVTKGIPEFRIYLLLAPLVIIIWGAVFKAFGLYETGRLRSFWAEVFALLKGSTLALLLLIVISFFIQEYKFSRVVFLYFFGFNILLTSAFRWGIREWVNHTRRKGQNLRKALIVGEGKLAQQVLKTIRHHPQLGIQVEGFLSLNPHREESLIDGMEVLGSYKDLQRIVKEKAIDQVFIALSISDQQSLESILRFLEDEIVDISVIPDIYRFASLRGGIEEFDGLPLINLRASPLYGWNSILKRAFDLVGTSLALIPALPLMGVIALAIKIFSPGSVFYKQERMGLDGESFFMYKFRTMKVGAEDETGPVWASADDPRRTKLGKFLRKTSLDELPQLFNVLKGHMSLVGPRPERPAFIEKFRSAIPRYMLRHKVKAGITGWAQINGWRGDTSLEKRIEHDLFYIENWSLALDLKIIFETIPAILSGKGAM